MTTKLSISVPDDVAEWLRAQENVSSAITDVIRAFLAGQRTDEVLRRAGFEVTEAGKARWRERLGHPIPRHAIRAGHEMIGRRPDGPAA
jgi:hypothetical protein